MEQKLLCQLSLEYLFRRYFSDINKACESPKAGRDSLWFLWKVELHKLTGKVRQAPEAGIPGHF